MKNKNAFSPDEIYFDDNTPSVEAQSRIWLRIEDRLFHQPPVQNWRMQTAIAFTALMLSFIGGYFYQSYQSHLLINNYLVSTLITNEMPDWF